MKSKTQIIIADDHPIFIEGIIHIIEKYELGNIVNIAQNGKELLSKLNSTPANLLIIDINMPILNGLETIAKIKDQNRPLKILVISMNENQSMLEKIQNLGANGFLPKSFENAELIAAIHTIMNDNQDYFPNLILEKDNLLNNNLTKRELEIIELIIQEKSTKEISEILQLSIYTIDTHRKNIGRKTGAKTALQLSKINFE